MNTPIPLREAADLLGLLVNTNTTRSRDVKCCHLRENMCDTGWLKMDRTGRTCTVSRAEVMELKARKEAGEITWDMSGRITVLKETRKKVAA